MMFEQTPEQRQELLVKAVDFAGKYARTFDPELLQHLYRTIVEHTLPATASLQERCELDGQRKLIVGIIRQYQLATTGSSETPWAHGTSIPKQPQATEAERPPHPPRRRRK